MTAMDDKPHRAIGAYWLEEADYPAVQKIFDDGNKLPRSWDERRKIAEHVHQHRSFV